MLVFSAVNFFSRTSRPIALTPSRSVIAGLYQFGMVDAPGRAMRPVDPDAVADLAAEQFVAGHAQHLGLGVEQRVFDRAQRLRRSTPPAAGRVAANSSA